jgi:hypothetical protein
MILHGPKIFPVWTPSGDMNSLVLQNWDKDNPPGGSFHLYVIGADITKRVPEEGFAASKPLSQYAAEATMWVYFGSDLTVTKCRARILAVTTNDPNSPANWRKEGDILWGVVHPDGPGSPKISIQGSTGTSCPMASTLEAAMNPNRNCSYVA